MRTATALALLVTAFLSLQAAIADSWPAATVKAVVSPDGKTIVRVIPGGNIGDTYGFAGAPKGEFASAQWFRFRANRYEVYQTAPLLNPVAPIHVAVANDGTVITLDNWHNVGFGYVVVIYSPDGNMRKRYRLEDLYPPSEIEKIKRSVSSRWWRCAGGDSLVERNGTVQVDAALGGRFTFQLESGSYTFDSTITGCAP
jgi:hypothetical protein